MVWVAAFGISFSLALLLRGKPERPPRRGGWAVLAGLLVAAAAQGGVQQFLLLRAYWLGVGILLVMGAADDRWTLTPRTKFGFQAAAALLFLYLTPPGVWAGRLEILGGLALPIAFLWLVGVTNALNLLDNMDGLCAGVGAVAAFAAVQLGWGATDLLGGLAAGLVAFLLCNVPPARLYLGDAGSHLVGFSLAVLPLYGLSEAAVPGVVLLLAVPIVDTTFVFFNRLRERRSPFEGGNDHLSHRLWHRGCSPWQVAMVFWSAAVVAALAAGVLGACD